ncbi:hypothetical protein AVEN_143443-1 [Araneus ventricosus]|uniref:Uncharacterized protein n=1 Tax=Araneus ventricosus TaxID=182803 RepID=A0A4Y2RTC6_ARAVE|nr:hypothetical protein AVEN_143443-1 [Araneus ventricosus]
MARMKIADGVMRGNSACLLLLNPPQGTSSLGVTPGIDPRVPLVSALLSEFCLFGVVLFFLPSRVTRLYEAGTYSVCFSIAHGQQITTTRVGRAWRPI